MTLIPLDTTVPHRPIRILVADPDTLFRAALSALLATEPGMEVVGEAADGATTLELLEFTPADALLLEPVMRRDDAGGLLRQLHATGDLARTIVLTGSEDPDPLVEALQLGARGIVMKRSTSTQLLEAIEAVVQNRIWLDERFIQFASEKLGHTRFRSAAWWQWCRLTPRQREIVALILQGLSNREIAHTLSLASGTISVQLHHVYLKLAISSRRDLEVYRPYADLPLEAPAARDHRFPILGKVA
jgi:DNA-binding NarL/FixJ family response regulator